MRWLRLIAFTLITSTALAACGGVTTVQAPTTEPTQRFTRPTRTPKPTPTMTPTAPPPPQAIIQIEALNVREGPGTAYTVVAKAAVGETL